MSETMYEEIDRRIRELQRPDWEWVKQGPDEDKTMCAIVDFKVKVVGYNEYEEPYEEGQELNRLSQGTIRALNKWLKVYTEGDWDNITMWNDADMGPQSVDEVIELLEKFRAEL